MRKDDAPSTRDRVHEAVRRYPGIHVRGLERQTGASAPLVQYHLKKLVEDGLVEAREQGGYVRYFPAGSVMPEADATMLGLLREEVPLHVALLLMDEGALTHGELLERVGIAKSTLSYHLAKLAAAGIVDREPRTTRLRLVDRERVYALLLKHQPTPDLLDTFARLWGDLYG